MPEVFLLIGSVFLGLLVGGLANAKVMRTKDSLIFTTSRACSICAEPAHAKEMLPIVGYFAVKGRCHRCKAVIPWQYPATEAAFAVLFAVFAARALGMFGLGLPGFVMADEALPLFIRDAFVVSALVLIFVFDYRAYIIPDRLTIPAILAVFVCNLALGVPVMFMLLGGLLLGSFFAIQFLVSQGRWVGGGDIRMGVLMGLLLGPWLGLVALLISYIFGSMVGIFLIAAKRRSLNSHVPFGTFMAVATVITMLWGDNLLNWYLNLMT